jgi:hypothetical protein
MEELFLPSGKKTELMPGDRIIFTQTGNNPETVTFYRGEEKLFLVGIPSEYPDGLTPPGRLGIAKRMAAAASVGVIISELGARKTVFLVHSN